ncbi:MAG: hypothetical protein AAGA31_16780, partial [Bacteroidota bacterium]
MLLLLLVWGTTGFTQEFNSFARSISLEASFNEAVDLNDAIEFVDQPNELLTLEQLKGVDNWQNFSDKYQEKEEKRIWARVAIDVAASAPLQTVLYLHDLQSVNVHLKTPTDTWVTTKAGRLLLPSER